MNPAQASTEFGANNRLFVTEVIVKRNFSALDRIYTAGARILPPGAPMIQGRENIRAFWESAVQAMNATGGALETLSLEVLGDTAVEIGRATVETDQAPLEVKYVVVWKREDNTWKWHIDIWNLNA